MARCQIAIAKKKILKMDEQGIDFRTESSFSAVGLFFGFLVRDDLTKLWKVGDL